MKKGWELKKLVEISKVFEDGDWVESKDQSEDGVRLIQTGNIGNGIFKDRAEKARYISEDTFKRLKCTEIFEGDCLISRLPEPVGRACILPSTGEKMITAVDCTIIRLNEQILFSKWFLFYTQSHQYQKEVNEQVSGATRQRISRKNLGLIEIPLPPLPEQQKIVALLDKCFEAIDKAKLNAERNLQNAKELFASYLKKEFENGNWEEKVLGDLCLLITKGSSPKWQGIKYVDEPGILFVTSENVGEGKMLLNERKYVEEKFNLKDKKSILKKGDVLTNIVGASIGRTAIYDVDNVANINQAVCILRCNPKWILNSYLMNMLNSPFLKKILHDNEVNTARANLSLGFFNKLSIPCPSMEDQQTIVSKLDALRAETQKLETVYQKKISDLEELKKSILQKAFNGELNTENIEI